MKTEIYFVCARDRERERETERLIGRQLLYENISFKKILTIQDQRTTLKQITDDESQRGYSHDYDHFSYDLNGFDGVQVKAKRIDAVRKYCNDDFEKYYKTISDHIPVVMNIELK